MITIHPVTLEGHGVRLEPLAYAHHHGLAAAAAAGKLWELWFTTVPEPEQTRAYIADALAGQAEGHMLPWAVRELTSATIIGSTGDHDGTVPDTVIYSILATEWPDVKRHLELRFARHGSASS